MFIINEQGDVNEALASDSSPFLSSASSQSVTWRLKSPHVFLTGLKSKILRALPERIERRRD